MQVPSKIVYRNVDPSEALTERIEEKVAKLEAKFERIIGCHVVVEQAHHHHNKGNTYSVRIDVTLPGGELLVSEHTGKDPLLHEQVYRAMNSAFSAMERQLEKYKSR